MGKLWNLEYGQVGAGLKRLEDLVGVTNDDWVRMLKDDDLVRQVGQVFISSRSVVSSDPIIHVDRTIRPTYPNWVKKVMHPKLELTGPGEFDVSKLEQWLHPDQVNGQVGGKVIYEHLKQNNMLEGCLGLLDLEAIQKKGITFFRQYFQGKVVFGWKSVVLFRRGDRPVPFLVESDVGVVLSWYWLDAGWDASYPALRFASPLV